ncbi:MAG: ABC transporter substrate-binding protein [Firmicutes bacterium]|nr:ABC transporter substrate-binding protein [Bacillota bacterium]
MKARKVFAIVLALALVLGLTACGGGSSSSSGGSTAPKVIKIGVMQFGEFDALINAYDGFVDGLEEAGYKDGQNIEITYLSAAADTANCPTIADTLLNNGSDLIFAIATPSVSCIKEKTSDVPVIFTAVTDPVGSGLVASHDQPGANITGTSDMNPVAAQIDLLKEAIPEAKTVAVMYCSSESNSAAQYELAKAQIEKLGMTCVQKTISAIDEAKSAVESLKGQVDAIYIPTDNTLADGMNIVAAAANDCGLPTICGEPGEVASGGFITYGINYYELGKQSAKMAVEVLEAADPIAVTAGMAVQEQTDNFTTAYNKATLEALGITLPQSILDRAEAY